ncbi:MAG: SCO family protein [Pyrinomonadaceae bacterium MAG19_C2-C3]|nr:SCO family protein [Pyrinomonadaceae bacterium MAG19_C2-C3]
MNTLTKPFSIHQFDKFTSFFRTYKFAHLALASLSFLIIGLCFSACTNESGAPLSSEARRYKLTGKVLNADKSRRRVQVAHDPISDNQGETYMEAMTMDFALHDEALYEEIKSGDEINATLVIDKGRSYLDEVSLSRPMSGDSAATATRAAALIEPQPGTSLPNFTLINQDGKNIQLADYKNRVLLLTFIYTRCPLPDYCPLMSENFAAIKKTIAARPDLRDRVRLLSITFDPLYDTPAVLREYAARYDAQAPTSSSPRTWEFATGTPAQISDVAKLFNLSYTPTADGTINHSLKTALIDEYGKLIKLYRDNGWTPQEVTRDIERHFTSNNASNTDSNAASNKASDSVSDVRR